MKKLFLLLIIVTLVVWTGPAVAFETGGVDIHGFISQGFLISNEYNYLAHNSTDGSFEYNEVGINFGKQLNDKLHIGMQLFSRDLGDAANNKIALDWAFGDYRFKDWLGLRAGRIRLPKGLYNETRDMDMLRTNIVMPQGIYNDFERDYLIAVNGASLHGNVELGGGGSLQYQLLTGALNSDPDSGAGKYTQSMLGDFATLNGGADIETAYAGALRWETPIEGLRVGYTFLTAETHQNMTVNEPYATALGLVDPTIVTSGKGDVQVFSVEYTWRDLIVAAEYMQRAVTSVLPGEETETDSESYYLSASYRFTDLFTLGAYYSVYYPDKDDKDGINQAVDHKAWEKDLALSLRLDLNEYWVFKIEGHAVDGTANVLAIDNSDNDYSESQWYYGAAKVSFNF